MSQSKSYKILFVCLGNICRSPAAEGAFKKLVEDSNLQDRFIIDSAGTGNWHIGELPHRNTRTVAEKNGIKLTHKARQFSKSDFDSFDYILVMDSSNYEDVMAMARSEKDKSKIFKFRKFDPTTTNAPDVPDPYYGGMDAFEEVYEIVTQTSKGFLEWIKNNEK